MVTSQLDDDVPAPNSKLFLRFFPHAGKLRNGECSRAGSVLTPVTVNPKNPATTAHPMTADPNGMGMRPNDPMTAAPYPSAMPQPGAGNPNVSRSRRNRHRFGLRGRGNFTRRRRFGRNGGVRLRCGSRSRCRLRRSNGHSRRRRRGCRLADINDPSFHTSRQNPGGRQGSKKQK
jgi:hypothetical protein